MVVEAKSYLTAPIEWSVGADPEYPYEAKYEGHKLLVRLNDFPEEELYALIADGEEITNFDDWPNSWTRPSVSDKNYPDRFAAGESTQKTRKLTKGVSISLPDKILFEQKTATLLEKRLADLYSEVKRELDNSTPTDIGVVTRWAAGMTLKQISEETGIPISTVQRHLKAWQQQVLEKTGLHQIVNEDPELRIGAYELIQNAVKKFTRAA